MMTLSILILSYNTRELTLTCIQSISDQYKEQLAKKEFEIIVVDNASADKTVEAINKKSIKIVENKENFGFSKGNNIGAKEAKGKYILFLNSDTQILDDGMLRMVTFLDENESAGVIGGRLQNTDGSVQPSAGSFYNLFKVFIMLLGGERAGLLRGSPKEIQPVDWVSGAAFMIRKDVFNKLGGFDEHFFMYLEDMELCFRARKKGFLTFFYPQVKIVHATHGSSNRAFAIGQIYKGLLYFYKKHGNYISYIIVKVLLMTKAYAAIIIGMFTRNTDLTSTYRKAVRYV